MTKQELITYIKNNDHYFRRKDIDNLSYETLEALSRKIEALKNELPNGFKISSSGYDVVIEDKVKRFNSFGLFLQTHKINHQ